MSKSSPEWLDRFLAKVGPPDENGCTLWLASPHSGGYGQFKVNGKCKTAHVLALELATGEHPAGLFALHTCDVKMCVNPDHLYWGTPTQNMADMVSRNRQRKSTARVCERGHRLVKPNLVPGRDARGWRMCLACHRTRCARDHAIRKGREAWSEERMQYTADQKFQQIMESANV